MLEWACSPRGLVTAGRWRRPPSSSPGCACSSSWSWRSGTSLRRRPRPKRPGARGRARVHRGHRGGCPRRQRDRGRPGRAGRGGGPAARRPSARRAEEHVRSFVAATGAFAIEALLERRLAEARAGRDRAPGRRWLSRRRLRSRRTCAPRRRGPAARTAGLDAHALVDAMETGPGSGPPGAAGRARTRTSACRPSRVCLASVVNGAMTGIGIPRGREPDGGHEEVPEFGIDRRLDRLAVVQQVQLHVLPEFFAQPAPIRSCISARACPAGSGRRPRSRRCPGLVELRPA